MRIEYFDTTMRDGAQSLPETNQFPVGSKPEIANVIASLGVGTIEAGFPATPSDAEEVNEVATTVGNTIYRIEPTFINEQGQQETGAVFDHTPVITGLSRCVHADIDMTWEAVSGAKNPGIHIFVSVDDDHMRVKHPGMTPDQVLDMAVQAILHAGSIAPAAKKEFSLEAASTADPEFTDRVVAEILQHDVNIINMPDTIGQARPLDIEAMFYRTACRVIKEGRGYEVTLSTHNHNDCGMALINSMAAAQGVKRAYEETELKAPDKFQVEAVVGGLGERAGNTAIEQVINYVNNYGAKEGLSQRVDTRRALLVAEVVFGFAGLTIPRQAPVVGSDILKHRSGIHSDGVIKGGAGIYTPFDPRWFGHGTAAIIENGKYQGRRGAQSLGGINSF